ncbi:DedD protein [Alkalispirillum mobile]|uniref:DedD protein n=1 Tax=Alkalispirillum mobile TaxID=85925 RepID=A0A498CCS8_9GAMM|nr:SPOR domain-containing protein [Alkalispirillum mobile]RLK50208.1 DedD protein [Alkalispirillum mobile]
MEQHIKHRLAGAVILVALAVIILPWLFSGNGEHSELDMPLDIPPAPEVSEVPVPEARDGEAPVEAPRPEPLPEPELPAEEELAAPRSDEPDETPAEPEAEEPPVSEPEPEPVPDVAEPEPEAAPEPEPEPEVTEEPRTTEEGLDIIPPDRGDWVVQVGSFGNLENALGFRDRLREDGLEVFADRVDTEAGRTFYRVRVGPMETREEAQRMLDRLEEEQGLEGLVAGHP